MLFRSLFKTVPGLRDEHRADVTDSCLGFGLMMHVGLQVGNARISQCLHKFAGIRGASAMNGRIDFIHKFFD